jgi:hypothetical protein
MILRFLDIRRIEESLEEAREMSFIIYEILSCFLRKEVSLVIKNLFRNDEVM